MFITNGFVRCMGYRRSERYFTVGRVYAVQNDTIINDNGYCYYSALAHARGYTNVHEFLSDWYILEPVEETSPLCCSVCGEPVSVDDCVIVDGKAFCNSCAEENVFFCDECGRAVLEDDCHAMDDMLYCTDCFREKYTRCVNCGELVAREDCYLDINGDYVCEDCRDTYYHVCEDCGELIHEDYAFWGDDDCPRCESCHNELFSKSIHRYHYKPMPIFYGDSPENNPLYMGVELEIDNGGENGYNAQKLLDIVNEPGERIYMKHDGSIEDGFEIVSHPATLEYHAKNIPWAKLMKEAVRMGYRSHDTETCGLHVHVSRRALGSNYDEQESTISKIIYFVENNWAELLRFTRRTESNLCHWASRYGIEKDIPATYSKAKCDGNRYRAINLLNDNTIEFRVFRGTLNHNTFLATLQFVDNLCKVCRECWDDDISKMRWADFISRISAENNPELFAYLEKRGLNV
jgi:formylmethanofuran dehydrogenase subunit E